MSNNQTKKIYIFALAATGLGISGSDRIFIEFAKQWCEAYQLKIFVWEEGYRMVEKQGLAGGKVAFQISPMYPWKKWGFFVNYLARIIEGIIIGYKLTLEDSNSSVVYSASDFWMDSLPAFILKLRFSKIHWVASWYQTAPVPWRGYAEGFRKNKYFVSALVYWLMQLPMKFLISKWADLVLINNELERKVFPTLNKQNKLQVVLGAVDVWGIKRWRAKFRSLDKVYDAVFQGRFHPQKGVIELIDIWQIVLKKKPHAKLVMIGDGPLMQQVRLKIKNAGCEKNIILKGYLFDGEEKYRIFAQSKVVLHPAFYDSGGMAAAEAMAFGLPAVGFDLKSFESYYPKGMIKVKIGDLKLFADTILGLLNNANIRIKLGRQALDFVNNNLSWDSRAREVVSKINSL